MTRDLQRIIKTACFLVLFLVMGMNIKAAENNLSLQEIKKLSCKQVEVTDAGKVYEVYLFSENGKKDIADLKKGTAWSGYFVGDSIITGNFKLAYVLKGQQDYKIHNLEEMGKDEITIDLAGQYVQVISNKEQNTSDFLTIFIPFDSSNGKLYIYTITDGVLHAVPCLVEGKTNPAVDVLITADQAPKFTSLGNLKFKGVTYHKLDSWTYYMSIYKYNAQKKALEQVGETTRWANTHFEEYPFTKPYSITNQEIKALIRDGHKCLRKSLQYTGQEKVVDGRFLSEYSNKKELAFALETYWSKEYVQKLLKKYNHMFKETSEGLYIMLGDIGTYYDLDQATITKVEDSGKTKKVYMKAKLEGESGLKTIMYTLSFTNHGWVLQGGGSNPML